MKTLVIDAGLTNSASVLIEQGQGGIFVFWVNSLKTATTDNLHQKHYQISKHYQDLILESYQVLIEDFNPGFGKVLKDTGWSKVHYTSEFIGHIEALAIVHNRPITRVQSSTWKPYIRKKFKKLWGSKPSYLNVHEWDAVLMSVWWLDKQGILTKIINIQKQKKRSKINETLQIY